jgi:hypothetical protein
VYCLRRERWQGASIFFHIDHFLSAIDNPDLITEYDNLLYCCASCNAAKGAQALPNPLAILTSSVVSVEKDGTINSGANSEAAQLIKLLGLNSPETIEFRKLTIDIVALALQNLEVYHQLMGYPEDLPNLRKLKPPLGNSRPDGVERSAFARRERGELPSSF